MQLSYSGSNEVTAPRPVVWQHLLDPQFVAASAPGVDSVEQVDDSHFKVFLALGLGALKLHFTLAVELFDVVSGQRVTMRAQGNAPGSGVEMTTAITLDEPVAGHTMMNWRSDCEVSGILAGVGGYLLEGTARKLTEQFWLDFADRCTRAQPVN
jgi:carbon monoxide dehydrogenase subunit G